MAIVTIKSIRAKITGLKRTRGVNKPKVFEAVLSDMLSLIENRLGSDVEISEVTNAMGEGEKDGTVD